MDNNQIYEEIAWRTGGDIYIGVVGPVRTGKSTFIKRFMETMVNPQHRQCVPSGTGQGRAAPKWLRADHYDGRTQICAGGSCSVEI